MPDNGDSDRIFAVHVAAGWCGVAGVNLPCAPGPMPTYSPPVQYHLLCWLSLIRKVGDKLLIFQFMYRITYQMIRCITCSTRIICMIDHASTCWRYYLGYYVLKSKMIFSLIVNSIIYLFLRPGKVGNFVTMYPSLAQYLDGRLVHVRNAILFWHREVANCHVLP